MRTGAFIGVTLGVSVLAATLAGPARAALMKSDPSAETPALSAAALETTSEDFGASVWRQRSEGLVVLADSYPASLHRSDAFLPIPVAIGFRGKNATATFDIESFTLFDAHGREYPMTPYTTLAASGYGKLSFDHTLLRQRPIVVGQEFAAMKPVESRFYPTPADGGGSRTELVQLAPFTWFRDVLYFPRPAGGLDGILTLRVTAHGLRRPVDVRFRIPPQSGQKSGSAQGSY